MRVVHKAVRRPEIEPPPTHREHEVTVRLPHDVCELAAWAFQYEQSAGLQPEGRTFEAFLADMIEGGLDLPVTRWHRDTA